MTWALNGTLIVAQTGSTPKTSRLSRAARELLLTVC